VSGPVLELLVAPGTSGRIAHLVRRLASWCDPRAPERLLGPPAARLASSWRAPSLAQALAEGEPPCALWVAGLSEMEAGGDLLRRCRVVVTDRPEVGAELGAAVVCPRPGFDPAEHRPLAPFVRARWRARLGLAVDLVVDVRNGAPQALPERLVPTALAVAAAAVVDARRLDLALALGTAVVTDDDAAEGIGATDGVEVVIAAPSDAAEVARALAGDLPRAAALGRAGRRDCERRHDLRTPAAEVATRLGLMGAAVEAEAVLRRHLGALWTPADARVAARASAAVVALGALPPASVGGGW
jgi:hypothetical protein